MSHTLYLLFSSGVILSSNMYFDNIPLQEMSLLEYQVLNEAILLYHTIFDLKQKGDRCK